jgi:hypothetical protein
MSHSDYLADYLNIENNQYNQHNQHNQHNETIENFSSGGGSGAVGQSAFGSGSVSNAHSPGSRSPSSMSQGGGKIYGSYGYAMVSPTGAMSGISNPQPNSASGLGFVAKGAKTGTFTGGSFGGDGKYVVGFPGIKPGSNLPALSSPSLYMKPKLTGPHPTFFNTHTVQEVTLPYGHIEKHVTQGIPAPTITNKYDNVGCNFATELRGPKFPYNVDLQDKNLTGLYNYRGFGYYYDPFYWGLGPWWPITGVPLNYPDIPYNYEDLMQKEVDADNIVNTIQDQLATQFMEENIKNKAEETKVEKTLNSSNDVTSENSIGKENSNDSKENFESGTKKCNKNTIVIILAVILIIYILLSIGMTETEKSFSL